MGNTNGREDGGAIGDSDDDDEDLPGSNGGFTNHAPPSNSHLPPPPPARVLSSDLMANSPPHSPALSRSPLMFAPQDPVAPLQRNEGPTFFNQMWNDESLGTFEPAESRIPTLIMWSYGGSDVTVEGSWDNWTSRKKLQRSGKDHSILLVLPSGVYHYRFVVDGEQRYIPDLPSVADEMGHTCNLLDVHDNVPENVESVSEFEAPLSPEISYGQSFLGAEDFAKEPMAVPPQLHVTVLDMPNSDDNPNKPQHVVLNHLFIEKGSAAQSVVALGLTHRFQSKYTTVVLYKPLRR